MDATDTGDATDYDKTFIEEPAILDKYKAAAEVCDSKYHFKIYYRQLINLQYDNQLYELVDNLI